MNQNSLPLKTKKLLNLIEQKGIESRIKTHDPVFNCEQAAEANSCTMHSTLKALILEDNKGNLFLALLCGDEKLDFAKVARVLGNGKMHLADKHKIETATGFTIGAIPPFGFCQPLPVLLDSGVLENETVVFNAGNHSVSIHMKAKDLLKINSETKLVKITQ